MKARILAAFAALLLATPASAAGDYPSPVFKNPSSTGVFGILDPTTHVRQGFIGGVVNGYVQMETEDSAVGFQITGNLQVNGALIGRGAAANYAPLGSQFGAL